MGHPKGESAVHGHLAGVSRGSPDGLRLSRGREPTRRPGDTAARVPNLWFGLAGDPLGSRQRFHVEVYVAPEVIEQRIAAALAVGGTVVDNSNGPGLTVIADQEGNKGIICADVSVANPQEE